MKKLIKLILIVSMMLCSFSGTVYATDDNADIETTSTSSSIVDTVRSQVTTFAKSINQSNADDSAASALAKHGLTGRGKTLKVGKNHALSATLMNAEMSIYALSNSLAETLILMEQFNIQHMSDVVGYIIYYNDSNDFFRFYKLKDGSCNISNADWIIIGEYKYTGKRNEYDNSLEWITGNLNVALDINRKKVTNSSATYEVKCTFYDFFDFSTSNGDGFKDFISGIGSILFKEYKWESTVTFNVTVPFSCDHNLNAYHWSYNSSNRALLSDSSSGYHVNNATYVNTSEDKYYILDKTVKLYHDKPWVIEYDIRHQTACFTLNSMITKKGYSKVSLMHDYSGNVFFESIERLKHNEKSEQIHHYYGTSWNSKNEFYTYRFENVVNNTGNTIYLTVLNPKTGEIMIDKIAMDDYYQLKTWEKTRVFVSDSNAWMSGKDIFINYIGNESYPFLAVKFDLRIYENGKDIFTASNLKKTKTVKPTCTEKGYTIYTCSECAQSVKKDYTSQLEHKYTSKITAPTCNEQGYTTYTCTCGDTYKDHYVEALGHSFTKYVSSNDGTKTAKCDRCDETDTIDDILT